MARASHSNPAWRPRLVVTDSTGPAYHAERPGHASLSLQPAAPEATPPVNHTWRSYYQAAGRRVAMRVQDGTTGANQVHYLFADHLGSTNVTYNTRRPAARRRNGSAQPSGGRRPEWTIRGDRCALDRATRCRPATPERSLPEPAGRSEHRPTGQRCGIDGLWRMVLQRRAGPLRAARHHVCAWILPTPS